MKTKLLVILLALCLLLSGCGKSKAVLNLERQISAIGKVSLQSAEDIERAETAYAALSPEEKEAVKNYSLLEEARIAYDALVEQQNEERIKNVEEMIGNLTDVTLERKAAVEMARIEYDELGAALQERVSNAQVLFDAEERIALLEKVLAINFKSIACKSANLFEDTSFDTWFDDDTASATLAFCFHLQGDSDGWLSVSHVSLNNMVICQNKADRRYDLLLPSDGSDVYYVRYWPEKGTAQMATVTFSTSVSEYAELLIDAGVVESYKKIPFDSYVRVLNVVR